MNSFTVSISHLPPTFVYTNPDIAVGKFEKIEKCAHIPEAGEVQCGLMSIDRMASKQVILREMDRLGKLPVPYKILLAFHVAHPTVSQRKHVVALGTVVKANGRRYAPYRFEDSDCSGPSLGLAELDWKFDAGTEFLVVDKT